MTSGGQETNNDVRGFDVPAAEAWISQHVEGLVGPFQWRRLEGGHSNLTYAVTGADGVPVIVRRPPEGPLLPKAHDMEREWRVIEALFPTTVPVAEPLALCTDTGVIGAPFYVMGFVEGRPFYSPDEVEDWVPESQRHQLAMNVVDALAALHAVDPESVGLGRHGRPDAYITRQLRAWYGSWNASIEPAGVDDPVIHQLHDRLAADIPEQGRPAIVHGDYMVHNVLFDQNGTVTAVVDWEISTLGDPLADLAYLLNGWARPDDRPPPWPTSPTLADGFPPRAELAEHYGRLTGRDLSQLRYYVAFNYFKSACILHGVYARYRQGQKDITPDELEELREHTLLLIERARLALAEL
ncbi:MAG: phosphotransferase family protein [Acidimicrobiia bacterium]|nr:phosphotransferase family protein [Acidimicrobiia bacterium]